MNDEKREEFTPGEIDRIQAEADRQQREHRVAVLKHLATEEAERSTKH
jgi:hypothetical protein